MNQKESGFIAQIPNLFTLCNLFLGCLAIVYAVQTGLTLTEDSNGESLVIIPENIYWASICIVLASVVDFLDGFVARLLKASSDMGKQLDSLADVVSFGVAPGMIVYQFLRLSFAQQPDGLDISTLWLMPAFILPCAGAYRLARFNIDTTQSEGFKGVPIPAVGIIVASFPLIYWYNNAPWAVHLLGNYWFWYALIAVLSYLMVSTLPMLALKFKQPSLAGFLPFIIVVIVAIGASFFLKWFAVSVAFITYVVVSLLFKKNK